MYKQTDNVIFYLDPSVYTSVRRAVDLLNGEAIFNWHGYGPGYPVFVKSELKGWYKCVVYDEISCTYDTSRCNKVTGELPNNWLPLTIHNEQKQDTVPQIDSTTRQIAENDIGVGGPVETVAWLSQNAPFSEFNVSKWSGDMLSRDIIYIKGPSLRYRQKRRRDPEPTLPKLSDETFRSHMAKLGLTSNMIGTEDHKYGHYYFVTKSGIRYITDVYNTKMSLALMTQAILKARRLNRIETPLEIFANSDLYDKNMIKVIQDMVLTKLNHIQV